MASPILKIRLRNKSIFRYMYIYFLFTIFILHSGESDLYRYVLDGMSALAWELLLPRCLGHLSST